MEGLDLIALNDGSAPRSFYLLEPVDCFFQLSGGKCWRCFEEAHDNGIDRVACKLFQPLFPHLIQRILDSLLGSVNVHHDIVRAFQLQRDLRRQAFPGRMGMEKLVYILYSFSCFTQVLIRIFQTGIITQLLRDFSQLSEVMLYFVELPEVHLGSNPGKI